MASASLKFVNRLEGASNFISCKVGVTLLLEENDLWDTIKNAITLSTDPQNLSIHEKKK